jgi:molybdenum cofactor guanylyltransferase
LKILGVIVAGGLSSRMGQEKALITLGGVTLLERVVSRLRLQVDQVVLNANGDGKRFGFHGLQVFPDVIDDVGTPLAGLHAALAHGAAQGFDAVVTVPSDTPFLPLDLVAKLTDVGEVTGAAYARSGGQDHYLTGMWTVALAKPLEKLIREGGLRRVQDFCAKAKARRAVWETVPHDPFFNLNTPEDVIVAEAILEHS